MPRTGRRPGRNDTRERILASARQEFADHGLDKASVRGIARRAAVDPALIHHYFGTKERLFVAAVELPFDPGTLAEILRTAPRDELGERFARVFLGIWDDPAVRPRLLGVLRSAMTDPGAAAILRDTVVQQILQPLVSAIRPSQPELRATLLGSQAIGLALARYIVAVEPLASLPGEEVVRAVGPTFQRYLLGDL